MKKPTDAVGFLCFCTVYFVFYDLPYCLTAPADMPLIKNLLKAK